MRYRSDGSLKLSPNVELMIKEAFDPGCTYKISGFNDIVSNVWNAPKRVKRSLVKETVKGFVPNSVRSILSRKEKPIDWKQKGALKEFGKRVLKKGKGIVGRQAANILKQDISRGAGEGFRAAAAENMALRQEQEPE